MLAVAAASVLAFDVYRFSCWQSGKVLQHTCLQELLQMPAGSI